MTKQFQDLQDFQFDGKAALQSILAESSYGILAQTIASLTKFSHPDTVAQTNGKNLFRIIRCRSMKERGDYQVGELGEVMLDDNSGPIHTFVWANGLRAGHYRDIQFNHVWQASTDVLLYTNLANLCITPAFLAKLTDTDSERAYELYQGFKPENTPVPKKPEGYDLLDWAAPLPPVNNLEQQLRQAMATKPKNRTVRSAKELGWYFSGFMPDSNLVAKA